MARQQRIVGRRGEQALFESALDAPELPFCLLYLHGPGGIGKTTLLESFRNACVQRGIACNSLDGRYIDATPDGFRTAATGLFAEPVRGRQVLLIDTYERIEGLDGWLRDVYLPSLPGDTLVVIAGRNPLSAAWRADVGWQALLRTVSLGYLSAEDSRALLAARDVPAEEHNSALDFARGYPLALSLVADLYAQKGYIPAPTQPAPDVIQELVSRLLGEAPSPRHREVLEACALLRVTTEPVLGALVGQGQHVHSLYDWLSHLSFVDQGPVGLYPHDLARDALIAELRWRNPERYAELHHRARAYYVERLRATTGQEQQRVLWDYFFLHRDNAIIRNAFTWQDAVNVYMDTARESDRDPILKMMAAFEGQESAEIMRYWWNHPAHQTQVFRSGTATEPLGFLSLIALEKTDAESQARDPAIAAAVSLLQRRAPLRAGETSIHFRFWMAKDSYHSVSPIQSLIMVNIVRLYITTPHIAFTFFPVVNPDGWAHVFRYAESERLPDADFEVGGRRYGIYGHDWRAMPPTVWLSVLADKELGTITGSERRNIAETRQEPSLIVMDEKTFVAEVRNALKHYAEGDGLIGSPLLNTRCVVERAGNSTSPSARAGVLRIMLKEAVEALQATPRQARAYRVLIHTYVTPAPTQEKAAERLDLPFSTYRRHLAEGIALVARTLWLQETGGSLK